MARTTAGNLIVVQGGGPTAVFNASLYGVVRQAQIHGRFGRILGARHGVEGLLDGDFADMGSLDDGLIERLPFTPGAALGSSRLLLSPDQFERTLATLRRNDARGLVFIGGDGSMTAARRLAELIADAGDDVAVIGVPKTVDNDVAGTDRAPGFASAARYVAQTVRDLGVDVRSLPVPVSIFETMGRDAGWLAGSALLAREDPDDDCDAPHLVYLAETPFDVDAFLGAIDATVRRLGWAVAVVSEGVRGADGELVFLTDEGAQRDAVGRALPGDVGSRLAGEVASKLHLRCRSEKPGLCGRSSILHVSTVDRRDAECVGRAAVDAVLTGQRSVMVALQPWRSDDNGPSVHLVPLETVAGRHKRVPTQWISPAAAAVSEPFIDYVRPLLGPPLLDYARLPAD
jgi:6-phosphofructokinase